MSARINELRANSTSGAPCIRMRQRLTRTGKPRLFVEVTWHAGGQRGGTSFPADRRPTQAVQRAIERREAATGVPYPMTARQVLLRILETI